jgi:methenyltetrahydrofolate cyclohydrolase
MHVLETMSTFAKLSVSEFLDALANSEPTPGGGTASAIAGAMGASLLIMVASLAKSRNNTDEEREALGRARTAIADSRATLIALADKDAAAFDDVMAAFKLPKATDEDKAARSAAIQRGYRGATEVPLETLRIVTSALAQAETVAALGNRSATSDVGVAVGLLEAGAAGATANVEINLGGLKDQELVARFTRDVVQLAETARNSAAAARASLA